MRLVLALIVFFSFVYSQQVPLYGYDPTTYGLSASNYARTCLDIYIVNPTVASGSGYWIKPGTQAAFQVYCDFTNGTGWTLIESASNANIVPSTAPFQDFGTNNPSSDGAPNWTSYRLSLAHMTDLMSVTQRWRATCNAHTSLAALMSNDFIVVRNVILGITSYANGCFMVDAVNIRGYSCTSCYVYAQQGTIGSSYHDHLRVSSASGSACSSPYLSTAGALSGEKNFGYYDVKSTSFGCTATSTSTTNVSNL
jgi:hypothetical protein